MNKTLTLLLFLPVYVIAQNVQVATYSQYNKKYYALVDNLGLVKTDSAGNMEVLLKMEEYPQEYKYQIFVDMYENIWLCSGKKLGVLNLKTKQLNLLKNRKGPVPVELVYWKYGSLKAYYSDDGYPKKKCYQYNIAVKGKINDEEIDYELVEKKKIDKYKGRGETIFDWNLHKLDNKKEFGRKDIEYIIKQGIITEEAKQAWSIAGGINHIIDIPKHEQNHNSMGKIISTQNGLFHFRGKYEDRELIKIPLGKFNNNQSACLNGRKIVDKYKKHLPLKITPPSSSRSAEIIKELDDVLASCRTLDQDIYLIQGWLYYRNGNYKKANELFQKYDDDYPKEKNLYKTYALYKIANDPDKKKSLIGHIPVYSRDGLQEDTAIAADIFTDRTIKSVAKYKNDGHSSGLGSSQKSIIYGSNKSFLYALRGAWKYWHIKHPSQHLPMLKREELNDYCDDVKKAVQLYKNGDKDPKYVMLENSYLSSTWEKLTNECNCNYSSRLVSFDEIIDAAKEGDRSKLNTLFSAVIDELGISVLRKTDAFETLYGTTKNYEILARMEAYGFINIKNEFGEISHDPFYINWLNRNAHINGTPFEQACYYLQGIKSAEKSMEMNKMLRETGGGYSVVNTDVTRIKDVRETRTSTSDIDGSVYKTTIDKKVATTTTERKLVKNDVQGIDVDQSKLASMRSGAEKHIPIEYEGF